MKKRFLVKHMVGVRAIIDKKFLTACRAITNALAVSFVVLQSFPIIDPLRRPQCCLQLI